MDPGHEVFLQHCWILPLRDGEEEKAWSIHTCNMVWVAREKYHTPNYQLRETVKFISDLKWYLVPNVEKLEKVSSSEGLSVQLSECPNSVLPRACRCFQKNSEYALLFSLFPVHSGLWNKPLFSIRVHKAEIKIFMYCCLNNKISLFV